MNNRIVDISLFDLLNVLWLRKWIIVFVSFVFGCISFLYYQFFVPKTYTSDTRIYVVSKGDNKNLSHADLQAGSALTKDYKEIILSDEVLEETISDLKLESTLESLASKIKISIPAETRIISISVTNTNSDEAARIANGIRKVAALKIKEVTQVTDVTTLQTARPPQTPSGPHVRKSTTAGLVLGAFLTVFLVVAKEILDDRIKRFEELEKLGIPILGSIPLSKNIK